MVQKMSTTLRMLPPGDGKHNSLTVAGRTYSCALGSTVDVPDFDASIFLANGWVTGSTASGGMGVTSARPKTGLYPGIMFHDTTLGYTVVWDGYAWRNPTTGASV